VNWTWYLFGFEGRINRAKYWLGSLVMFGWMLLIAWLAYYWLDWWPMAICPQDVPPFISGPTSF
jgi:uncharacterized membrane protein YhaH (DUF805 family)